jgi:hypothetical protein
MLHDSWLFAQFTYIKIFDNINQIYFLYISLEKIQSFGGRRNFSAKEYKTILRKLEYRNEYTWVSGYLIFS